MTIRNGGVCCPPQNRPKTENRNPSTRHFMTYNLGTSRSLFLLRISPTNTTGSALKNLPPQKSILLSVSEVPERWMACRGDTITILCTASRFSNWSPLSAVGSWDKTQPVANLQLAEVLAAFDVRMIYSA